MGHYYIRGGPIQCGMPSSCPGPSARPLLQLVLKDILKTYRFSPDEDDARSSDDETCETEYSTNNTLCWHRRGDVWRVAFSGWCRTEVLENESADVALIEMEVRVDAKDPRDWLLVSLELFEDPHRAHTSLKRVSNWAIENEDAWRRFDAEHIRGALNKVDQMVESLCKELSDEETDADEDMLEA